jgi:hypothetical protein
VQGDNSKGDKGRGMRSRRSPWALGGGGEGGVRRVAYGRSTITCYLAVATRHHWISAIPRIQAGGSGGGGKGRGCGGEGVKAGVWGGG